MIFNFQLDEADIKAISEAMAEAPFKNVNATIQKMQMQINLQTARSKEPAADEIGPAMEQPIGKSNGSIPLAHSS